MKLIKIDGMYAVSKLSSTESIPHWALQSKFYCITRSEDELSIICEAQHTPEVVKNEKAFRLLRIEGQLDFDLTGILASIANPLADAKISIFAVSTFDTDYILLKAEKFEHACQALKEAGFVIG